MPRIEEEEVVLKCQDCGEFLHARVVTKRQSKNGPLEKLKRQELFCPNCDKPTNLISAYKKQKTNEKKQQKNQ